MGFDQTQAQIDDAQHALHWFHTPQYASQRGFCSHCGSPMFFQSEHEVGELHITRALFTTPIDRNPEAHIHHNSRVDWVQIDSHLPIESD